MNIHVVLLRILCILYFPCILYVLIWLRKVLGKTSWFDHLIGCENVIPIWLEIWKPKKSLSRFGLMNPVFCIQYPVSSVSCTYSLSCIILVSMYPLIQSISYLSIYLPRPQITEGRWFDHALLSLLIFSILTSRVHNQTSGWSNHTYRVK